MVSTQDIVVEVKLPRSLFANSGMTRQEASDALLRSYVLTLYRHDKISSGKAAQLLGVHKMSFIRMLSEEGIPYLDFTKDELDQDVEALSQWHKI